MLIVGFNKTTLLDYPGRVAATIFTGGCNFKCPFCHNGGIVLEPLTQESYSETEIIEFLYKRKNILKGVCITGGEPVLQADLPEFISKIKRIGLQVKLDTNGYIPTVLKKLLDEKLLDYVAMDIKNCRDKYAMTAGMCGRENQDDESTGNNLDIFHIERIEQSIELLKQSSIPYEFRTTVVKELHTMEDLLKIAEWIKGCPYYFLQQYQESETVIYSMLHGRKGCGVDKQISGNSYFHGYQEKELKQMAEELRKVPGMTGEVSLRGVV